MKSNKINTIEFKSIQDFKSNEPQFFAMVVTPSIAEEMLSTSVGNRKLTDANIKNLIREMQRNNYNWKTGETIKFDNRGILRDGHHRLNAIVQSGLAQTMLIFTGAESVEKIDSGKTRSLKESFIMSGEKDTAPISKLGVNILRIKNGLKLSNVGYKKEFPIDMIISFCNDEREFMETIIKDLNHIRIEGNWVKKYPKTELSVIGSIIYDMVKNRGYNYTDVISFTKDIFSHETSENPKTNDFRNKVIDDSYKHSKKGAWTFEEFRVLFIEEFKNCVVNNVSVAYA